MRFGRLFGTIARCYIESPHANRSYEAGQPDTGKANHHSENSRHEMSWRQIAIADSKTGHKTKIQQISDPPPLYIPDQKSGRNYCQNQVLPQFEIAP